MFSECRWKLTMKLFSKSDLKTEVGGFRKTELREHFVIPLDVRFCSKDLTGTLPIRKRLLFTNYLQILFLDPNLMKFKSQRLDLFYLISINPPWLQNYQGKICLHFIQRLRLTHSLPKLLANILSLNFRCSMIILWKYKPYISFTKTIFSFLRYVDCFIFTYISHDHGDLTLFTNLWNFSYLTVDL